MVPRQPERVETVVIGGGQAGLSVGYHLARHDLPFVILDANHRVGDSWRRRWDSLRLFTPARFDGLDGMPFPGDPDAFPTKDEMGGYLEAYATRFALPVRNGVCVDRLTRENGRYLVSAGDQTFEADHVVVAMANYQRPRVPAFAKDVDPRIVQLHSADYRQPSQLQPGPVLLVGAGNSGAEIALEVARAGHPTWMSGRDTGYVPFRIGGRVGRLVLTRFVLRFVFHRLLTVDTPIGRRVKAKVLSQGGPLIRVQPSDLAAASVVRVPRTSGVRGGLPLLEDGRALEVANIIWCTGFDAAASWIALPIFDEQGQPIYERGAVVGEPGLYFVGRHFQFAMSSTMIHGVGRDARHIADMIAARLSEQRRRSTVARAAGRSTMEDSRTPTRPAAIDARPAAAGR
jgi:putative flavoprotein involved in K+ transport